MRTFIASFTASVIAATLAFTSIPGGVAAAQPSTQPSAPAAASGTLAAEAKAAKGVDKKEPVEPGDSFTAATKVWIWSRVTGGTAGSTVKHVWKKDDKTIWTATLKLGGATWTTSSRRQLKPGSYSVDVVGADGTVLTTVSFTVT